MNQTKQKENAHIKLSTAPNSINRCRPTEVAVKSKSALQAATAVLLSEFPSRLIKLFATSASAEICSLISNDASDAAPTISTLLHTISAQLQQQQTPNWRD